MDTGEGTDSGSRPTSIERPSALTRASKAARPPGAPAHFHLSKFTPAVEIQALHISFEKHHIQRRMVL
jgi:hypothetical protein